MRLLRKPAFLGLVWLALSATPGRSADMTFSTVPYGEGCEPQCPRVIQAIGPITPRTPQAFLDFARREIDRPGLMNVVLIHSNGGSVNASQKLGRIFRQLGSVVVVARTAESAGLPPLRGGRLKFVAATCASACVYSLAGGARRVVPPESKIAVHRMAGDVSTFDVATRSTIQRRVYAGREELDTLNRYMIDMGVSPELVALAESVPHEVARVLSTKEITRMKLGSPKL